MKLEYILVFRNDGIPIYSHCFGMFCAQAANDDTLLTGFLSALTSMPQMFGQQEQSIQLLEMDYTKLFFSKSESGKITVIGVDRAVYDEENDKQMVEDLFDAIEELVDEEFLDIDWNAVSNEERYAFEHKLVDDVLPSVVGEIYQDYCRKGEDCLFNYSINEEEPYLSHDMTLWDRLQVRYEHNQFSWIVSAILRQIIKLVVWIDRRSYQRNRENLQEGIQ